jgi:hypothetical protein
MAIQDITPKSVTISEEDMKMLGIEVDTEDFDTDYIPRRSTEGLTKLVLNDLKVGQKVTGEPELVLFINDEKEINGQKYEAKTWDTINMRLFSDEDYLQIYINIPKVDENGFIHNIHENNNFLENCFNLIFGYMRLVNEDAVIDPESETGYNNHFKKINIKFLIEKLNELTDIEIKVTKGQKGYQGFLITEIWD